MGYNFKRSDLKFDYKWTAKAEGDNAKITGFPDNFLLDRNEGYEVLPFIKRYVEKRKWVDANKKAVEPSIATGQKVEQLIHKCPSDKRSHKNIEAWIQVNW
ncbi:hypothetical protein [Hymenobacter cavernae]|uniref:Uncharacterized protein n=1 Tax=Hymenobacter cavernae TaxID=2044852 RepID=A0ABQ1UWT1_9BACT|nr:hypothetical protein [Hymenobacter cavernae]GGF27069.1 hypothetical protein GCM10011383_43300 [Hymenobacter cavernae]